MSDVPLFADLGEKSCRRCAVVKPLAEFPASLRATGTVKFGPYCRPCQKEYHREWYLAHRDEMLAAAAGRREQARASRAPEAVAAALGPLPEAIGFQPHANPRVQGDAGLGIAIAYFSRIGARVGIPLTDSQPYDLMVDDGNALCRVQVRTTTVKQGNAYVVGLKTVGANKTRVVTRPFDSCAYEWLFAVCGDATVYLIPTSEISARYCLFLGRKYEQFRLQN